MEYVKYENINSGGCPIQGNAKKLFFPTFCEKSVAQTSIWHIFFKEGKGVSLGLFHKWHPDIIKDNTQLSSPNAECDGYPLKKRENNVATFLIFFLHFYLIIGTYFSHFRDTWWFLWSIKILCSPQVVLSNRGLHFVKILWLIYRKTIINIPQKTLFFQKMWDM